MADMTIVTYGGGQILYNIFNAVAMFFNGSEGALIRPLVIITASIGAIWALSKAFFSSSTDALLVHFLFPLLALPPFLMVPSSTVHIEDHLQYTTYKVDHVPFLLAKFSEMTSTIGYRLTEMIETVMQVPDDISYNKTGMLFGAETSLDISRYQLTHGDLEQNMRQFTRQCILYDLALGRYSLDELKKTSDLWNFLKDRTSKVRMIPYVESKGKKGESAVTAHTPYLTCKEALEKMEPLFAAEKKYYAQHELLKHLPLTFQALTQIQKEKEELIGQQLMLSVLSKEYSGQQFAKARAQTQQTSTYQALGSLASGSLVTMRAVIEALVYGVFVLVVPLAFLPGGFRILGTWAQLTVWIQLWPPLYAILNYIMQSVAVSHAKTILDGLNTDQQGLSIFTSVGLQNLNQDIHALSGYLALSVPLIAYAILRGGTQSIVQLTGALTSPAQSAASSAAAEQASGHYSLASTNFGQTHYQNVSAHQKNLAPSLNAGFFAENDGTHSMAYTSNEAILKQANTEARTSVFSDDAIQTNLQKSYQHAESHVDSAQKNYMESLSNHTRSMTDLTEHLSRSSSFTQGISEREAHDIQESARYMQNVSENWGSHYGMSTRKSLETLVDAGSGVLGLGFAGVKGHKAFGVSNDEAHQSATHIAASEEFQQHYQKIKDFSENRGFNSLNDEGVRLVEGYTQSLDSVRSSQQQYQSAYSELNQASENMSWAESHAHSIRRSLNQDLMQWGAAKYHDEGGYLHVADILNKGSESERETLINDFVNHLRTLPQNVVPTGYTDPHEAYKTHTIPTLDRHAEETLTHSQTQTAMQTHDLHKGDVAEAESSLNRRFGAFENQANSRLEQSKLSVDSQHENIKGEVNVRADASLSSRLWQESGVGKWMSELGKEKAPKQNYASKYQIDSKPFWHTDN